MPPPSTSSVLRTPPPACAVEIARDRVTAVALSRRTSPPALIGHGSEPLDAGVVAPGLTDHNVLDATRLAAAVRAAVQRAGSPGRRIGLVVPDTAAKVSLVRFEKIPPKADDLRQLIQWQVRKTAPFRVEDAQLSFYPGAATSGGGREYVVIMARRDLVEEYEQACGRAGLQVGLLDLATPNLINCLLAARQGTQAPPGDWLIIHLNPDYRTIAIVRAGDLVFFRSHRADEDADQPLPDLVHQTAMYYEDRLGGQRFERIVLAHRAQTGGSPEPQALQAALGERLGSSVGLVDLGGVVTFNGRKGGSLAPELLAPAIGLLVRDGGR